MENVKNNIIRIYGLVDPITNEVRYVGKTKNTLKKRLSQHLWEKNNSNQYKLNWINKLKKQNLIPNIIELETCDETNWVEKEKYWINKFENLTNITQGGDTGIFFTQEILDKISIGVKKVWTNEIYYEKMCKIRKEYWANSENRERQRSIMIGNTYVNPELSSIRLKELWKNEEYIHKMSTQSKKLWENDNYKKKVLGYLQSGEHKLKVSERLKGKKLTEDHKFKMSKSCKNKQIVCIGGILYDSITEASKLIPMNRSKLKQRLKSKNFPNYKYGGE